MKIQALTAVMAVLLLTACGSADWDDGEQQAGGATSVKQLAKVMGVHYQLITNQASDAGIDCAALGAEFASCSSVKFTMEVDADTPTGSDWLLYAHSVRRILALNTPEWQVEHITGDLHRLIPPDDFTGFKAGEPVEIILVTEFSQLFESDIMPNWYLVDARGQSHVIKQMATQDVRKFIQPFDGDEWRQGAADHNQRMTASRRFERNRDVADLPAHQLLHAIIPTPEKVEIGPGRVPLSEVTVSGEVEIAEQFGFREKLAEEGVKVTPRGLPVKLLIDPALSNEAYQLTIENQAVRIKGGSKAGLIWGIQSFLAVVEQGQAPQAIIIDEPRYRYRGMQVDVARHHRSVAVMKRLIDHMSMLKLNTLHLGLTNDEGWRIEIPGLPELTGIGGKRCHDLNERRCLLPQLGSGPFSDNRGSGFFSVAEYEWLVDYANDRGIEVIPEINMPGHARAAVIAMEARFHRLREEDRVAEANEYRLSDPDDTTQVTTVQLYDRRSFINPCLASSHRFVDKVMSEIAAMHQRTGQPLKTWHYGGDEAKNIKLGAGFEDIKASPKEGGKGLIDRSKEDHPFARSPACEQLMAAGEIASVKELPAWFAIKVGERVKVQGIGTLQAWQDGLKYASGADAFATGRVAVNFWEAAAWGASDTLSDWGSKGYKVILSTPDFLYFDFPQEVHPQERGFYWAARYVDLKRIFSFSPGNLAQNAETVLDRMGDGFSATTQDAGVVPIGISGQQWGETVRTDAQFEYMVYPRIFALAERAWRKESWALEPSEGQTFGPDTRFVNKEAITQGYQRFANVVSKYYLARLERAGVNYRLPVPGGRKTDKGYQLNLELPGMPVEYQQNGVWRAVKGNRVPLAASAVRVVQFDGKRSGRVQPLE